jgi:predicted HTH transcriptional regulator
MINREFQVFVSSVQKELEDERLMVQNLLNTDPFLSAHCAPLLYEFEPASPQKALEECLKSLDRCQVYLLIVAIQYGSLVGDISITHAEYRRAKENKLPVLTFIKGDRGVRREAGTDALLKELDADGTKYKCFGNVIELQKEVCASLVKLLKEQFRIVPSSDENAYFHRIEERGSGFRRMRDQMLDHGLDQPLLGTDTGYFQVTFPGPGENLDRLRMPVAASGTVVTPAMEAQLNERQKKMVALLVAGEKLTSRRCEDEFGVTRDTAARGFNFLMEVGLASRQGRGRSTSYILAAKP